MSYLGNLEGIWKNLEAKFATTESNLRAQTVMGNLKNSIA